MVIIEGVQVEVEAPISNITMADIKVAAGEEDTPLALHIMLEGMMVDISSTVVVIMVLICSSKTAILG